MVLRDLINEKLTDIQLLADTDEQAIMKLGELLIDNGFTDNEYVESVWTREQEFPTGIENNGCNFAITHANGGTVHKPAIAMGVLKEPVEFKRIDDPSASIPIKIVLMLAFTTPEDQLEALKMLVKKLQSAELFNQICSCNNSSNAIQLICGEAA